MKTAKRFAMLAGLALALMAVLSFAGCSKKGEIAKVAPESDFEFKLSDDGTFITLARYNGNAKNLVIPETIQGMPVEVIGEYFAGYDGNNKIKSVVIPSSVKVIEPAAFIDCESLEKVTLPEGLLCIGGGAFRRTGLTSVTLPEGLLCLGANAFTETALTSITFPKSLEYLAEAFYECDNLAEINIPDDAAFLLKNAPEYVASVGEYMTEQYFTIYGDNIFSGSIIDESVALQKKLKEIKCVNCYHYEYYPKLEETIDKFGYWLRDF